MPRPHIKQDSKHTLYLVGHRVDQGDRGLGAVNVRNLHCRRANKRKKGGGGRGEQRGSLDGTQQKTSQSPIPSCNKGAQAPFPPLFLVRCSRAHDSVPDTTRVPTHRRHGKTCSAARRRQGASDEPTTAKVHNTEGRLRRDDTRSAQSMAPQRQARHQQRQDRPYPKSPSRVLRVVTARQLNEERRACNLRRVCACVREQSSHGEPHCLNHVRLATIHRSRSHGKHSS